MKSPLTCLLLLGFAGLLAFLAFLGGSTLLARAEDAFGPPSPRLNTFQRVRIGMELGWRTEALLRPVDPNAAPVRFDIALGEPTSQIVSRLWFDDLIREGQLFSNYLFYTGLDTQLQAGSFEVSAAMNSVEIAAALLDPTPGHVTVSVLPGWRLEEIAASLPSSGIAVTPEEFLQAAISPPDGLLLPDGLQAGSSLEGYLRPGAYEVEREADVIGLLSTMLLTFDSTVSAELRTAFQQRGLSLHEALTLASIVEREAVDNEEMPLIASVFLNRLATGMHLQADPTVQYAVGYDVRGQWWPNPLTLADLQFNSPYNTYVYAGLPPGPIAASGLQAQEAVAYAPSSPYYYFQAACDGSGKHVFAITYEEHLGNNCR